MSEYYFAFGSNMNKERMKERNARFAEMQKGIIKDWKLVFNKINSRKDGAGFANIEPEKDSVVEGIIYKVEEDTLQKLDRFEGVPNHYIREMLKVENDKGVVNCTTYIANPSKIDNSLKPEKSYLNHLLEGKEFLSDGYFFNLKNIETLD
jgi:gamma-glutamylcyclotransferase